MIEKGFEVPVVLFIFKRKEKVKLIIERISQIKPQRIYIIADGPRNENEIDEVRECRIAVEESINWDCEIIKNYAEINRGVYENIGLGAEWVFRREEVAIFLEDDNLPEISFFNYCEELLKRYYDDNRILWICGTNYLQRYNPEDGASYVFTKHLMPCGWASWSHKFLKYYDGELSLITNDTLVKKLKNEYQDKRLYRQQLRLAKKERYRIENNQKPISWDYQMEFAIRVNNLYGISPKNNLIENIGVDDNSIHGGSNLKNVMTERFCTIKSYPLEFPLSHPKTVLVDRKYEIMVSKIILYPIRDRIRYTVSKVLRYILGVPENKSIKNYILRR